MNLDDIKDLLKAVSDSDVSELEVELHDAKVRIRRGSPERESAERPPYVVVTSAVPGSGAYQSVAAPASEQVPAPRNDSAASSASAAPAEDEGHTLVPSPIVGTFYESSSPGAPAFVEEGDKVAVGQVLCIIEAMKLMNEIESEVAGVVVKRFVNNAQPVEYGQSLFAIKPE
jgi:acetyl-CoA carboxylase biotin carboxyl carrier protein